MDLFEAAYLALTGNRCLSWQKRLYEQHFKPGKLDSCSVIDIPTGLGKTMVMAIWLIAHAQKLAGVPTRLIYVVDRRTVVDQASDRAVELQTMMAPVNDKDNHDILKRKRDHADILTKLRNELGDPSLAISTLRGQLADNREWSKDPSKPAIIIGTVDLIGSALLFSGYRSSYKRRPLEAGLLGQDSLLVLDEAHLSNPFEKLLGAIQQFSTRSDREGAVGGVKPMQVIRMSATSDNSTDSKPPFTLQFDANGTLTGEDARDRTITERFGAKKTLKIMPLTEKDDLRKKLAEAAIGLAQKTDLAGKRIVVFVRKPEDAKAVAKRIREHVIDFNDVSGAKPKKVKETPFRETVEVLTGTMRGLERDELVEKLVFKERWLNGELRSDDPANQQPVFLISTSAGEVGFDLNADHLIGDATPLDSWIQRLGRVNRRGNGDATVILLLEKKPNDKTEFDEACKEASKLISDGMDVSPKALAAFKKKLTQAEISAASTPRPTTVELTDILLDAWSMTSITQPMPGRPEVGPWLRGIGEWEPPQTTIAWRAELDLDGFADLDLDDIEDWFDTHRVLTHETLSVPTNFAAKELLARWSSFDATTQATLGNSLVIQDRAGIKTFPLADFMRSLERDDKQTAKTYDTIRFAEVILPASFGGIRRGVGLLDHAEPKLDKDEENKSPEERDAILKTRQESIDGADIAPGRNRQRIVDEIDEGEKREPRVIGGGKEPIPKATFRVELQSDDDERTTLVSYIPRRDRSEWGTKKQTLVKHVRLVRQRMDDMLGRLDLPETIRMAARLAANWHDHGKNRERWQRCAGRRDGEPPLGKSGGAMKRDSRSYRHEFGSLREFTEAFDQGQLLDDAGILVSQDMFDLAMHLIATHHGRGRPHFPKGAFDPHCERRSDAIHTEVIRRFARLQRKYGWWHLAWLENLLRCADALSSADQEVEDDPIDSDGGEP